jgi:hypothetical protein
MGFFSTYQNLREKLYRISLKIAEIPIWGHRSGTGMCSHLVINKYMLILYLARIIFGNGESPNSNILVYLPVPKWGVSF